MWVQHIGYLDFYCPAGRGAAIVELVDDYWFWQVDKPDDDINWTDDVFNLPELEGWWGRKQTCIEAQLAAEKALGFIREEYL